MLEQLFVYSKFRIIGNFIVLKSYVECIIFGHSNNLLILVYTLSWIEAESQNIEYGTLYAFRSKV